MPRKPGPKPMAKPRSVRYTQFEWDRILKQGEQRGLGDRSKYLLHLIHQDGMKLGINKKIVFRSYPVGLEMVRKASGLGEMDAKDMLDKALTKHELWGALENGETLNFCYVKDDDGEQIEDDLFYLGYLGND